VRAPNAANMKTLKADLVFFSKLMFLERTWMSWLAVIYVGCGSFLATT